MSERVLWPAFVAVPKALVDAPVSANAVRAFLTLADYSYLPDGIFPGRATMATRMNISLATLDRALTELKDSGFLAIHPRFGGDGGRRSNEYELLSGPSVVQQPLITGDEGASRHRRAGNKNNVTSVCDTGSASPAPLGQQAIAAYVEAFKTHRGRVPDKGLIAGMGKRAKDLAATGVNAAVIIDAMETLGARGVATPNELSRLVDQLAHDGAAPPSNADTVKPATQVFHPETGTWGPR